MLVRPPEITLAQWMEMLSGELHRSVGELRGRGIETVPAGAPLPADEAATCRVIEGGKDRGLIPESELDRWRNATFDIVIDLTTNLAHVSASGQGAIGLTGRHQGSQTPMLQLLRLLAEHPGKFYGRELFAARTHRGVPEPNTFAKLVARIRHRLGPNVIVDECVDTSVSDSGRAYCANPELRWVVIRYATPQA
jgi:hypothetical protein